MNTRTLFLSLALGALAACGQSTDVAEVERDPSAPPPVPVEQSTGGPCPTVEAFIDLMGMETVGTVSGYTIMAEPGRSLACSEPALGSVECAVTGPSNIRVESGPTLFTNYMLEAGQSGTLTVGTTGPACYLNANGG
jgi:hypothetical protein